MCSFVSSNGRRWTISFTYNNGELPQCVFPNCNGEMSDRLIMLLLKKIIYKNCRKRSSSSSDDDPGFRIDFGAEVSLPLTQGAPAVSHNTTRLYWMVFNLYECHIRSDVVTALFWIFFIYSLFFAGESPIWVKNVEVAFEIKPRHPISRGNMSVDQPFLVHYSRRSSYLSNFR